MHNVNQKCTFICNLPHNVQYNIIGMYIKLFVHNPNFLLVIQMKLTVINISICIVILNNNCLFTALHQVGKLVVACRWSAVYSTEP